MTTINQIIAELDRAAAASKAGDELTCARIAIGAQRQAARSRSRKGYDAEFRAHGLASLALYRLGKGNGSSCVRSELGRIAAESKAAFFSGGTNSRRATAFGARTLKNA